MKIESYNIVADCIFQRGPHQYPHPACTSASVLAPFNPFFDEKRLFLHSLESEKAFGQLQSIEYGCHNVMLILYLALKWPGNFHFLLLGSWPPRKN